MSFYIKKKLTSVELIKEELKRADLSIEERIRLLEALVTSESNLVRAMRIRKRKNKSDKPQTVTGLGVKYAEKFK